MSLKPLTSEKAVKLLDIENTITFVTEKETSKPEIKAEVEKLFSVKVESVRTLIRDNKKYAYVKLNKANLASDIASKIGMI
jgi:large subunit ribosomal protein L23